MTSLHTFRLGLSFDLSRLLLSVLIQLLIAVLSICHSQMLPLFTLTAQWRHLQCVIWWRSRRGALLTNSAGISAFDRAINLCGYDLAERLADDATTFWCHKNCISTYCSPDHIQRYLKRTKESDIPNPPGSSSKRLRSSAEWLFYFREHCLFCGEGCQVYDLKQIQTDGDRLIFAEQLTEKDKFHLNNQFFDKQKGEVIDGEMMLHSEQTLL